MAAARAKRLSALDHRRLEAVGTRYVGAHPDHLCVLREIGALRVQPLQGVFRDRGQLVAIGEQDGGADGRAGQRRGGDAGDPVVLVDQHHSGGPVDVAGGRIQGAGHAGGIGRGIAASHPDGVARHAGREAQLLGGFVVVGLNAELGRVLLALVLTEAAAAQSQREQQE